MACLRAAIAMTFSVLEGHSLIASFLYYTAHQLRRKHVAAKLPANFRGPIYISGMAEAGVVHEDSINTC